MNTSLPRALGLLFIATGATALIVEQAFEKLLSTVVGSSTEAGAIVLAVYFGGLCLGGLCYGRWRQSSRSPLHLYALLEGLVGVLALVLGLFFSQIQELAAILIQAAGTTPALVTTARLLVAAAWILPPTMAMGATYPAVVGALEALASGAPSRVPVAMARIYAANLLGACAAAFAGPYFLFPALGITGTLLAASALQALVVAGALALARRTRATAAKTQSSTQRQINESTLLHLFKDPGLRVLLVLAATSGFVIFALEVVWIHLIGATLGMSVYAFAMMLTLVLAGLFVGGLIVGHLSRQNTTQPDWLLPFFLLASSAATLICARFWDDAPLWLLRMGSGINNFADGEVLRFKIALLLLGLPSVVLGTVYPSLFRSRLFPAQTPDRAAGLLAAANAVGSIGGALIAAFYLLPGLGSEATLHGLGFAPVLLAVPLLYVLAPKGHRLKPVAAALGAAALVLASSLLATPWNKLNLTAGVNVYFRRSFVSANSRLQSWFEDAAGGITTVVDTPQGGGRTSRTLLTNGKFQGNDSGEVVDQITFGLVPSALSTERQRALVIGLGTGQSASVLSAAGFQVLEIADISRGIRAAARDDFKHINGGVIDSERTQFFLEDGRNHLLRSKNLFDVISMELTSVWFAGASNLYSQEFYRLAYSKLAPGGLLQQWVQLHHAAPEEVMSILATVRSVFPSVTLWMLGSQGCIIASNEAHRPLPEAVASLEKLPAMVPLLNTITAAEGLTLKTLDQGLFLDDGAVTRLAEAVASAGYPLNTDSNRYLEYATPRHNLEKLPHQEIVMRRLLTFVSPEAKERTEARFLKGQ